MNRRLQEAIVAETEAQGHGVMGGQRLTGDRWGRSSAHIKKFNLFIFLN